MKVEREKKNVQAVLLKAEAANLFNMTPGFNLSLKGQ